MNDSYLKEIGKVVVNLNSLEMYLNFLIWSLIGYNLGLDIEKSITAEMSFKNKVALFSSVFKLKHGNIKDFNIKALIKKLFTAEEERNKIIHSCWLEGEKDKIVTRYKISAKIKQGLKDEFLTMSETDVNKIASLIRGAGTELANFISAYLKKYPPAHIE